MVYTKEQSHAYYMSRRTHYQNYAKFNKKWIDCSTCGVRYACKTHLTTRKHLIAEQSLLSISLKKSLAKI